MGANRKQLILRGFLLDHAFACSGRAKRWDFPLLLAGPAIDRSAGHAHEGSPIQQELFSSHQRRLDVEDAAFW